MSWNLLSRLRALKDLLPKNLLPRRIDNIDRRGRRRPVHLTLEPLEERWVFSTTGVVEYTIPTGSSTPLKIVAGPAGSNTLWFTENNTNKIGEITTAGTFTEYTVPTAGAAPYGIALGADGNLWFTENSVSQIGVITPLGAVTEYALAGSSHPQGIVAGPASNPNTLWFTENGANEIGEITTSGTVSSYALPSGYVLEGSALTVGPDGNLWFLNYNGALNPFDFNFANITPSGTVTEFAAVGFPWYGLSTTIVAANGDLWGTVAGDPSQIERITTGGAVTTLSDSGASIHGYSTPLGMTADAGQNVWYVSGGTGIDRFTPQGAVEQAAVVTSGVLSDITVGPDGNLWFADQGNNAIGTLDWPMTGGAVTLDPQGVTVPVPNQPGSWYAPSTGTLHVEVPLDFMQTGVCDCGISALAYNSDSVDVMPVVNVTLYSNPGDPVPTTLEARLIWNGGAPGSWVTIDTTGHSAGDAYSLSLQDTTAVAVTGVYSWEIQVEATLPGSVVIDRDLEGLLPVVANDASPIGAGWSIGKIDSLKVVTASGLVPAGVQYIYGYGQSRFFVSEGGGAYQSPANDQGALSSVTAGGLTTYTYTTTNQLRYIFNGSGQLVNLVGANGLTNTYTYSGSLLTGVTMYDGGVTTFQYSSGLLTEVDEPGGRRVLVGHTGANLTTITNPDNSLRTFSYDASYHHLTVDQRQPASASYAYDVSGALTTITLANAQVLSVSPAWVRELQGTLALDALAPDLLTDGLGDVTSLVLDDEGRLLSEEAPDGSTWAETLDFAGNPTSVTDGAGQTTDYSYLYGPSGNGDLMQITYPDGTTEQFQYNTTFNEPTVEVDPNGNRTTMTYDATTGLLLTMTDASNHTTTYAYYQTGGIDNGEVLSVTDPNGNVTSYAYDASMRVIEEIDGYGTALASTATMIYDAAGNLLSETTGISTTAAYAHVSTTSYAYDDMRRMTEEIDAYGTAQQRTSYYAYDPAGDLLSMTDPNGNVTSYAYNAAGQRTEEIDGYGTAVASTATMIYDAAGNLLSETTGQSTTVAYAHVSTTSFAYDGLHRVTEEIEGYGTAQAATTQTVYDADGNVLSVADPNGNVTSYAYDSLNRMIEEIDGYGTAVASTATMIYDQAGNLLSETTGQSTTVAYSHPSTTSYAYDALNRVVKEIDGYGTAVASTATMIYDHAGNLLSETTGQSTTGTYANASTTSYAYDSLNRVVEEIDGYGTALASTATMIYDAAGNLLSETTGQSTTSAYAHASTTSYAYDALNQMVEEIDAYGTAVASTATMVYDQNGNLLSETTGQSTTVAYASVSTTAYAYDALNRQVTTTDANSKVTTIAYDAAGDQISLTDPDGNVTAMTYDALGRMISETDPLNKTATYAYDAGGRMTSTTDALGQVRNIRYDALNRETGETWIVSSVTTNVQTYTYDAASNQLTAANYSGAYTMAYDALNRMTSELEPFGLALTFSYDAASHQVLTLDSFAGVTTSVYNALGQMTEQQFGGVGQTALQVNLTWNAADQLATVSRYDDQSGSTLVGTSSYVYDSADRLTSLQHADGSGNVLASYTYNYDANSWLTQQVVDGVATTYSYDPTGQLTQAGAATYSYDPAGNRNMSGYQVGTGDQTTNDGTWTYTYDFDGELIEKSKGATAETWTYGYDADGRMVWAKDQSQAGGGTLLTLATYTYDVRGNLLEEDVYTQTSGTVTVSRYGYDGANAWVDLNGSNQLTMRRLYLDGPDQPFARIDSSGSAAWYLADRQGSITDIANLASTMVLDHLTYDAYGNVTESNPLAGDAYAYDGYRRDMATGYNLAGARWYDPTTGNWTTRDPSGFGGGDYNTTRYVHNGPTDWFDPTGLAKLNLHIFTQIPYLPPPLGVGGDFGISWGPGGVVPNLNIGIGAGAGVALPTLSLIPFHGNITYDALATNTLGTGLFASFSACALVAYHGEASVFVPWSPPLRAATNANSYWGYGMPGIDGMVGIKVF